MARNPAIKYHGPGDWESEEVACCRGCGMELIGKPYFMGGSAYLPRKDGRHGGAAKVCLYGGYVCSRECDVRACLALEQSMPGHGYSQKTVLPSTSVHIDKKWSPP